MNRLFTTTLSLMVFSSAGCLGPIEPPRTLPTPQLTITGFITKPDPGESYGWVKVGSINLDNKSVKVLLDPLLKKDYTIETQEIVKMRASMDVVGVEYYYDVFFGPTPDTSETAKGRFRVSSLFFQLYHGWVYLTGMNPTVETPWVTAGAPGSALLVHITEEGGDEVHRVFFVKGSNFTFIINGVTHTSNKVGHYIDVTSPNTFDVPRLFNDPPEVLEFYTEVMEIEKAGS